MKQNKVTKMIQYKIPLKRVGTIISLKEKIRSTIDKQEKLGCKFLRLTHSDSYIALTFKRN
jgi:hypothetical protein